MSIGIPDPSCPRCEAPIPAGARFCMSCGEPVAASTDTDRERQASLAAAAPMPLIEKMRAAKLTGERKPVTSLFVDVVGSRSSSHGPED
jgi:class 3 adenylate cyclase